MNNPKAIIEGLIFMAGEEGLTADQIHSLMDDLSHEEIHTLLRSIEEEYQKDSKGFELAQYASRYKFITKEFVYPYGEKLFEQFKKATLSQAALETLAIIAYRQPITRVEIEEVRGVNCEMMLKKLQLRGLIEAKDRLDTIGKPLLYQVTDEFLDAFELENLSELPSLEAKEVQEELFAQIKEE